MGFLAIDVRRIKQHGRLAQTWSNLQNCKSGHLLWSAEWEQESPQEIPPPPEPVVTEEEQQPPLPPAPAPAPQPVGEAIIVDDPQSEAVSVKEPEPRKTV